MPDKQGSSELRPRERRLGCENRQPTRTARRREGPDPPEAEGSSASLCWPSAWVCVCWRQVWRALGRRECRRLGSRPFPEPCRMMHFCLRQPVRAATLLASPAALKHQRSTTGQESRQFGSRVLHASSPSTGRNLLLPGRQRSQDGTGDRERSLRGASPALAVTSESRAQQSSPLRNVISGVPLLPSRDAADTGASTLQRLVSADPGDLAAGSPSDSRLDEPSVLVPRIVVTPERRTLDEGATTLWAAVQLSAVLCPASAPGGQPHHAAAGKWPVGHGHDGEQDMPPTNTFMQGA